jgi:hypothetical protein
VLSAHYALRAAEFGLESKEGQACLELALKLDARCERLDVTAIDLANRLDGEPDQQCSNWIASMPEISGEIRPIWPCFRTVRQWPTMTN